MSRFFVTPADIDGAVIHLTDKGDIHHMSEVLRLSAGSRITVSDSYEWEYSCVIESITREEITAKIVDKQKDSREPSVSVTLFQGIPKGQKLDDTVRKTTELGISAIVPVFMKRTVVKDNGGYSKKCERFRNIAAEASKQSGRIIIPDVSDPVSFKNMMGMLDGYDMVVFCYENEDQLTLKDELRSRGEKPSSVAVIIGPEGGFSEEEAAELSGRGFRPVTLGRTVLRTETAGTAALAMILYEFEL